MSIELPGWGYFELMFKAKKQLFKLGWRQMDNGRTDCIEKTFGDVFITTIWASNDLLLTPHKVGFDIDSVESYVPLNSPIIEEAKKEIQPIFDRIVKANKKKWLKAVEEYEKTGPKQTRSSRYGV